LTYKPIEFARDGCIQQVHAQQQMQLQVVAAIRFLRSAAFTKTRPVNLCLVQNVFTSDRIISGSLRLSNCVLAGVQFGFMPTMFAAQDPAAA
jgi:hypothetical protein